MVYSVAWSPERHKTTERCNFFSSGFDNKVIGWKVTVWLVECSFLFLPSSLCLRCTILFRLYARVCMLIFPVYVYMLMVDFHSIPFTVSSGCVHSIVLYHFLFVCASRTPLCHLACCIAGSSWNVAVMMSNDVLPVHSAWFHFLFVSKTDIVECVTPNREVLLTLYQP